eukprot:1147486-Pelagomonas_calceolata.AAC.5
MEAATGAYANRARFFGREHFVDLLVLMGTTAKETGWQPSQVRMKCFVQSSNAPANTDKRNLASRRWVAAKPEKQKK